MVSENKNEFEKILKNLDAEFKNTFPPTTRDYKAEYRKINEKLREDDFSYEVFLRVLNYKRRIKTEIDEKKVKDAIKNAKKCQNPKGKLGILEGLDGVRLPTASAILHFLDTENFVIVDKYTWAAFQKLGPRSASKLNKQGYQLYNDFVRELSEDHEKTPREIEMALMIYGEKILRKKKVNP